MSYVKAADVLPQALLDAIQVYVDGAYLYIPRQAQNRKAWGQKTGSKEATRARNLEIYRRYQGGEPISRLSEEYFLSPKSIQKIVAQCRREAQ